MLTIYLNGCIVEELARTISWQWYGRDQVLRAKNLVAVA
jgi:hypothetical protein